MQMKEKGRDPTHSYDKSLIPTDNSKKQSAKKKSHQKLLLYTTIADRLRTDSWRNDSYATGVVKPVYGMPTFLPTNRKSFVIKRTHI